MQLNHKQRNYTDDLKEELKVIKQEQSRTGKNKRSRKDLSKSMSPEKRTSQAQISYKDSPDKKSSIGSGSRGSPSHQRSPSEQMRKNSNKKSLRSISLVQMVENSRQKQGANDFQDS